jgi:CheY-like chemotaxis protein
MAIDVLVVDEEVDVLDITETFLGRQDGLAVSAEMDPERAAERVIDGEFDAVVSDLTMPDLDGLELCQRVRDAGRDVPFFLFTGRDESEIDDSPGKACVTGFVRKGTGTEQYETLAENIRNAVA